MHIRPEMVVELRTVLGPKQPKTRALENMPARTDVARMLRLDLIAAGIHAASDSGWMDFHALRTTCLSWLANAGTSLKVLQDFAPHSTPMLTMNVFARTLPGSQGDAAARLPDLRRPDRQSPRAPGTDDGRADIAARQTTPKTTPNAAHAAASACASGQGSVRKSKASRTDKNHARIGANPREDV